MKRSLLSAIGSALVGLAAFAQEKKADIPIPEVLPELTAEMLIAHRGESIDAPENTLPAYKTAVERGFGFECDIYLSKDNRVFTFHDKNLTRTTAGLNTNKCSDVDWEGVISKVDVGSWGKWKNSAFKGTTPALLEDVLKLARDGRKIYVEIKTGPEIVPYVKEIFMKQKNAHPGNTLFISFNALSCREIKKQMPEYKCYFLDSGVRGNSKKRRQATPQEVMSSLKFSKADGLDISFRPNLVTEEFVRNIRKEGYELHVWTIDDLPRALLARQRGAMTITTNCAKKLLDEYNLLKAGKQIKKNCCKGGAQACK